MNPYRELGVSPRATDREVSLAYKKLAKRHHPDLHPEDETAAERMGRINQAYGTIKAMRRQGQTQGPYRASSPAAEAAPSKVRHTPVAAAIAVVVVFFLVRLLLDILFGPAR